jgi:hypothetical protein
LHNRSPSGSCAATSACDWIAGVVPSPARAIQRATNPTRAKLIGKIVLARFLDRPAMSVLAAALAAEEVARRAGLFDGPGAAMRRALLPGARWSPESAPDAVFARVQVKNGKPLLVWRSVYFGCEYTVDGKRLAARLARPGHGSSEAILRAVRTLLLVSTRNRIAHEVVRVLVRAQREFLRTGSEARLEVLSQRQIVREAQSRLAAADASRVSRVLRSTVVLLKDGAPLPLRALCPSSRAVLRTLLRDVLERERRLRARGFLLRAWSDEELARRVPRRQGIRVSRRLVAYCRQCLGAPSASERSRHGCYMVTTMDFSMLAPLTRPGILRAAPPAAGVYELRLAAGQPGYEPSRAGIIYVGQAKNLRRRVLAHLTPNGRNRRLASHVRRGQVLFRVRLEAGDLKRAEEELYRQFVDTYGRPPECNRLSP